METPVFGHAAVAAPHQLACETGQRVLALGGNALEAMIAMAATVGVVYPHMNSLGGDGCFAQALYKLLAPDLPDPPSQVIGAALEISLHPDGSLETVHFVLRGPKQTLHHGGHAPPLH